MDGFGVPSEDEAIAPLLDEGHGRKVFGASIISRHVHGLAYNEVSRSIAGESHPYQLIAVICESASSTPRVRLDGGDVPMTAFARHAFHSAATFTTDSEWRAMVVAQWALPGCVWTNKYGDELSLASCVDEVLRRARDTLASGPNVGVSCFGTHILQSLTYIYCLDRGHAFLDGSQALSVRIALEAFVRSAIAEQREDGRWTPGWLGRGGPAAMGGAQLEADVLVTSHISQSIQLLSRPDTDSELRRALLWLEKVMTKDELRSPSSVCPRTHALCALLAR
jgi:hypothetical protein